MIGVIHTINIPHALQIHFSEHPGWWATLENLSHLKAGDEIVFTMSQHKYSAVVVRIKPPCLRPSPLDGDLADKFDWWWVVFYEGLLERA